MEIERVTALIDQLKLAQKNNRDDKFTDQIRKIKMRKENRNSISMLSQVKNFDPEAPSLFKTSMYKPQTAESSWMTYKDESADESLDPNRDQDSI